MKNLLSLMFILFSFYVNAQTDTVQIKKHHFWENKSVQALYQNGHVFGTNAFLKGDNLEGQKINTFQAFSIKVSTQSMGDKLWQQLYRYPDWGIGLYLADFHNPEELGVPIALYGFFNAPLIRQNKFSFNYEIGFGLTFGWKSFNIKTNRFNIAMGVGESFLIDAGLNIKYRLAKKFDLISGFSFTHFSNGALKRPNFGINTLSPKIAIRYNFYNPPKFKKQEIPKFIAENEWIVSVFGGVKNIIFDSVSINVQEKYEGVFFPTFGFTTIYNRQISYKSKIGVGMSFSYDGSINAKVAVENNELDANDGPFSDKLQISIFPSYELVINRISLILEPAIYIYRKKLKNQSPTFHQKIGLKYRLTDRIFIGLTLRDYAFHVSDFIEWNVGYRLKWK